jgi:hypothetical protein
MEVSQAAQLKRVHGLWEQIEIRSSLEYDSSDRRVVNRWRAIRQQSSLQKND